MPTRIFPRPEPEEVGYLITVSGLHIWVEAPEPVVSDEEAAEILQKHSVVWGDPCYLHDGPLFDETQLIWTGQH